MVRDKENVDARWIRFESGVERCRMDGAGSTVAVTIDGIGNAPQPIRSRAQYRGDCLPFYRRRRRCATAARPTLSRSRLDGSGTVVTPPTTEMGSAVPLNCVRRAAISSRSRPTKSNVLIRSENLSRSRRGTGSENSHIRRPGESDRC